MVRNQNFMEQSLIEIGSADEITLGDIGVAMEGYSLPWPPRDF